MNDQDRARFIEATNELIDWLNDDDHLPRGVTIDTHGGPVIDEDRCGDEDLVCVRAWLVFPKTYEPESVESDYDSKGDFSSSWLGN